MPDDISIKVNRLIFEVLSKMKDNLSRQIGDKATYKLVIQVLLKEHYSIPHLKKEIEDLKKDLKVNKETQADFMKELLLQKSKQQYAPAPPNGYAQPQPPPPPLKIPKDPPRRIQSIDLSKIKTPNDIKKALLSESKQVFTGKVLKPSQIIAITKPKHFDTEIILLEDEEIDKIEIDLDKQSSVRNNEEFFKRTEQDVSYVV